MVDVSPPAVAWRSLAAFAGLAAVAYGITIFAGVLGVIVYLWWGLRVGPRLGFQAAAIGLGISAGLEVLAGLPEIAS